MLLGFHQPAMGILQDNCKFNLQINNGSKSYDLTSVAYAAVGVPGRRADQPAVTTIQLCSAGPCAAPAAVCISATGANGNHSLVADAGSISNDSALVVKDSSQLQLDLAPGETCTNQGRVTTFQTSILFICESSSQGAAERLETVMGDCSLLVLWYTADACGRPAASPPSCPLLAYRPFRGLPGLAALTTSQWRAEAAGAVFEASLCGGVVRESGPCAAAPLCVTRAGGEAAPVGSSDRPGQLSVANDSVTLTYGQPGEERAEVLLQCSEEAGVGRLLFRSQDEQLTQLTLQTAAVCPVRHVQCQVTAADGSLRDLSQLVRTSGGWETTDRSGGQPDAHFYINMCRALNHDRIQSLCGGVPGTAVCMQSGGEESVSLGAVAGPPVLKADGSIAIVYTNGSQCGAGGDRYSSELQLVCGPEGGEPLLLERQASCRYLFLWETAAACGQQESSGGHCALSEPLYGHRLDVSSVRRAGTDYAIPLGSDGALYLNVCGPLQRRCAGAADQGACLVAANGTETSYGGASSRLRHADGVLSLTLSGGARCAEEPAANHSTRVVFTCDQRAPAAAEPGLALLGCTSYVVVPARQACPPRRTADCRTPDGRFDLSGLTTVTGNHAYHEDNSTYVLNVCHSVNPEEGVNCPAESGACLVRPAEGGSKTYLSLGAVSGGPLVDGDQLVLRYNTSERCAGAPAGRLRSTELRFSCDPTALGTQPRLVSSDGCAYRFAWTTARACPLHEVRGAANCSVQNPQTGYRFDLSSLARPGGHTASLLGFQYQLSVCGALPQPGNCSADTGVCKTTAVNPSTKHNVGMANDNLIYDDGLLLLKYSGGAPCGAGSTYSTIISFICPPEGGEPGPHVVEDHLCTVTVHWPTQLACETRVDCVVDTPDGLVDLSGLLRPGGTAVAAGSGGSPGERFTVNVCRPLGPSVGLACPAGSAACRSNGTHYQGLGHVVSPPQLKSDHVSLTYEHGSPCAGQPDRNLTSELQLFCDASRPDSESRPEWPQLADCRYTFQWHTAAACPLPPAAAEARRRCRVQRPDGTVSDLNTLTAAHSQQVVFSGQTVRLRPCQTALQCGGAVCVGAVSYGEPASFSVLQPSASAVTLLYSTEAPCSPADGSQKTRGATLQFICDPSLGRGTPTVTQLTACHVTVEWRSSAVCSAARSGDSPQPVTRGTGHVVAWLLVVAVAGAVVALLACRSRWRGTSAGCACCQLWGALRRQLLSPGTRASAHYRPVRVEDSDDAETALLLDAPLAEQQSPRPAVRRRPGQSPTPADMTDVCLDPASDSDDDLLLV